MKRLVKITFTPNKNIPVSEEKEIDVQDFQNWLLTIEKSNENIWIEKDFYGRLVAYFFSIVKKIMDNRIRLDIKHKKNNFKVTVSGSIESINKKMIFSRYLILMNNFNLFQKEITFFIENFSTQIENIEELFLNTSWELLASYE